MSRIPLSRLGRISRTGRISRLGRIVLAGLLAIGGPATAAPSSSDSRPSANAAGQTTRVDDTTGSLGGRLTTADGAPLRASVTLHRGPDSVDSTESDENGDYTFATVLQGEYQVSFYDYEHGVGPEQYMYGTAYPEEAQVFTVVAGEHTVATDTQPRLGAMQGRLVDSAGDPVAGYQVNVSLDSESNSVSYEATTGADGTWRVDGVYPARYTVSFTNPDNGRRQYAYGQGSPQGAARITVAPGGSATVDDTWLPGATLVVRATDSVTGAPVDRFCVQVSQIDADGCTTESEVTIADLAAGTFPVSLNPYQDSYYLRTEERDVALTSGETTAVTIPMVQGGKATATVTDAATGRPIAGTCIQLRKIGTGGLYDGYGDCSNAAGRLTSEPTAPGTYTVFAHAPGGHGHQWVGRTGGTGDQRAAARVTIKPDKVIKLPAIRLDRAGTVTGVVTGDDGLPIQDVDVAYSAWDFGVGPGDTTSTDGDGRYSLTGLGPYAWPLLFTGYDYARQWSGGVGNRFQAETIAIPAAGTATYDIALARGSLLRGKVTAVPEGWQSWRLTAVNAVTGDPIGVADHSRFGDGTYEMPLAGGQPVKIRWSLYGESFSQDGWWDNAADQDSATKISVPKTGTKRMNFTIGR